MCQHSVEMTPNKLTVTWKIKKKRCPIDET